MTLRNVWDNLLKDYDNIYLNKCIIFRRVMNQKCEIKFKNDDNIFNNISGLIFVNLENLSINNLPIQHGEEIVNKFHKNNCIKIQDIKNILIDNNLQPTFSRTGINNTEVIINNSFPKYTSINLFVK
jgi:hypothetical protein